MNTKNKNLLAKGVATVLEKFLKVEANSTSCGIVYQPKEPKELSRYKSVK